MKKLRDALHVSLQSLERETEDFISDVTKIKRTKRLRFKSKVCDQSRQLSSAEMHR